MILYNRLSNLESIDFLNKSKEDRLTLSFYKYFKIDNLVIFRNYLFSSFLEIEYKIVNQVEGSIYCIFSPQETHFSKSSLQK